MKLDIFETHDRLLHLQKDQSSTISQGADDCLKVNPLSLALQRHSHYVYLFAHPRTADDGVNKKMLWQPRLSKPKAQTNSYLFRAKSGTDILEICWLIPPRDMWFNYRKKNVTESEIVTWSINKFNNNRPSLENPFTDDISEQNIREIYKLVAREMDEERRFKNLYPKLNSEEDFSFLT
jgi:hypothetical protein